MNTVLDGIEVQEFNALMEQFIEREDPDAITFTALDEAVHAHLDDVTTTRVELTSTVSEGELVFDPPANAPIIVRGNELIIGGLHLVVKLRSTTPV